jgi:uncharacterized membrane protein YdjX (TVP38/TMEM64 family)
MHDRRLTTWLKLAVLVSFLAAAVYYFRFTERGREITPESVLDSIESHGPVTARLLYVAIYIVGTVAFLPGTVLSFAGAVLFGAYEGTLYTWTYWRRQSALCPGPLCTSSCSPSSAAGF